ncbi:MAG: hypothetical protein JNL07_05510 [Rhodospirillales bacterium]|nr:hypothetical protein [Rhodospirillales bacterium]
MARAAILRPALAACVWLALAAAAPAQQQAAKPEAREKPRVEISADEGIEWDKIARVYVARGNARVTRGEYTITADKVTAYYRETGGKNDVFRVDAEGNVRIASVDSIATGDKGVYDNDNKVARLTGRNLAISNPDGRLTARDSIELWDEKRYAVARGAVVLTRDNEEMRADQMVAYFEPKDGSAPAPGAVASKGKQRIARVEALGHVYLASCEGFAHADKGLYDPNTGTAVLTGNVRLTRGREQMNGETAEMNTRTGFTRLTGGRVTGLLEPNKEAAEPDPNPTGRPGARPCGEPKPAGAAPAAAQPKR